MTKAIEDIAAERARQIELGWTPEHDDEHSFGHLMNLALGRIRNELAPPSREELVQAAALVVAGIEWMDRAVTDRPDCPQPCEHLSQHDAREGRTCAEHPCNCADRPDGSAER